MKNTYKILIVIFFYISILLCDNAHLAVAQNKNNTNKISVYNIQLGAFRQVEMSKFTALNDLGTLKIEEINKNLQRLVIGSYSTTKDAKFILKEIRKRGYKKAFVIRALVEKQEVELAPEEKYVVQLGAFKTIEFKNFGNITDLGQVFVESSNDFIKASLGVYTGRERTEKVLKVLKKRGYKNAFIKEARTLLEK